MRVLIQRVTGAQVSVDGIVTGKIGAGLVALVGIRDGDTAEEVQWMAEKVLQLRVFSDKDGKMNLSLAETTAAAVATRLLAAAAVMFFAVLAGVVALLGTGMLPASPVWLALPVVAALLACWTTWRGVEAAAERRRQQLRQAANDFVQLVAVGLTTDQSVEEAIRFAVRVGGSPAFQMLRREIQSAPQRGVAVWEAIEEFGRANGIRELVEFATAVERQGVQGVSIGESVASLSASMRAASLDELEREADRANANLSGPTVGFVVATVVFLAYPLAQRISEAFGG